MTELSETTRAIYDAIIAYKRKNDGIAPTYSEITETTGIVHNSMVHRHIVLLEEAGYIKHPYSTIRTILVRGGKWEWENPPISLDSWQWQRSRTRYEMRNLDLMRFIIEYKEKNDGCAPSIRDMMEGIGLSSTSDISGRLRLLWTRGLIGKPEFASPRYLTVVGGSWDVDESV